MKLEEGGEVNRAVSEGKSDELKTITFGEASSLEVLEEFPLSSKIHVAFSFPAWLEM